MALLFMDGFDCYAATADLITGNRYSASSAVTSALSTTGGKRGGGAIFTFNGSTSFFKDGLGAAATVIIGMWIKFGEAFPAASRSLIRFGKGALGFAQTQCALRTNSSGQLIMTTDDAGATLATGSTVLALDTWYFLEVKVTPDNAGSFEVRLDGVTEISGSGVDTQAEAAAGCDWINFCLDPSNDRSVAVDDVYILDGTGSAPHNDFLGPIYIDQIVPEANNTVAGTATGAGSNFQCVDETRNNGDTDYVSFGSSGVDLYDMTTLSDSPNTIFAVQIVGNFRRDDATPVTARNKMKNGSTTSNGASRTTNTSYEFWADIYATNPDTSSAWTLSDINGLIAGVERV